jgi:hypothetical protein
MVQNLRDVPDLVGALGGAQNQIIVPATVEALPEPADLFQEAPPINAQAGDIVGRQKEIRRPVRFEAGTSSVPFLVYLVFVGVDEVGLGMLLQNLYHLEESIWRQLVAVAQNAYELPGSQGQGCVRQPGCAGV